MATVRTTSGEGGAVMGRTMDAGLALTGEVVDGGEKKQPAEGSARGEAAAA